MERTVDKETGNETYTFGELRVGQRFIVFPRDGDAPYSGYKAPYSKYRGTYYIFTKLEASPGTRGMNARSEHHGTFDDMLDTTPVLVVE
jgi:hypothetical protein